MSAEMLPQTIEQPNLTLIERLKNATGELRFKMGKIAAASALVAGGSLTISSVQEVLDPASVEAYDASTGDYPWFDASHVPQPLAEDPYTWGYTDKATCDGKSSSYDCGTFKLGSYYVYDQWGYYLRNCTSYVAWRVAEEFGVNASGLGNATMWNNNAPGKDWVVDGTPEIGDIAHFEGDDTNQGAHPGHVAFVEEVGTGVNAGKVRVAEDNQGLNGNFRNDRWVTASSYIDLNGPNPAGFMLKVGGSGSGNSTPPSPAGNGNVPYAATRDGEEFFSEEGWVYTRVGGAAFPIEHKNDWTASDTAHWGNEPYGPVPTAEVHDHEAGYTSAGRTVGAHPPASGTAIFLDTTGQQYYFYNGGAYPIGPGEVDDLGVRDKALRIPSGRLWDFTDRSITLPNGSLYRGAGQPNVKLLAQQPDGSKNSYKVGSVILRDCLTRVQGKSEIVLPQSALPYAESGVSVFTQSAACQFPPGWVILSPNHEHLGQWRIEGDNSSQPYTKRYFPSALTTYLHTSGNPNYFTVSSDQDIESMPRGADMTIPEGIAFVDKGNGAEYLRQNGEWHHVPWPDMNTCLGIAPWQIVQVPSEAVVALPQGSQATCTYTNRIIYGPNGAQYYVTTQGKRQYIGTTAISACIGVRRGAGAPSQVSSATVDSYPLDSTLAYCNYEQELGLNFVREYGDPTVWLVHPNGTKEHVGSFCVNDDPNFTPLKRFHLFVVPPGETAGHVNTGVFWANGAICDQLPGAGLIWHA